MPLLCLFAAHACVDGRRVLGRRPARAAMACGLLFLLWATITSRESKVLFDLWSGTRFAAPPSDLANSVEPGAPGGELAGE